MSEQDLKTLSVSVPGDAMPHVIGKGGSNRDASPSGNGNGSGNGSEDVSAKTGDMAAITVESAPKSLAAATSDVN